MAESPLSVARLTSTIKTLNQAHRHLLSQHVFQWGLLQLNSHTALHIIIRILPNFLIEMMRSQGWIVHVDELDEVSDCFGPDGCGSDDGDYTDENYIEETTALGILPQRGRYLRFVIPRMPEYI